MMKRSNDEKPRARYEDELRHEGRSGGPRAASVRHVSRRQSEAADAPGDGVPTASAAGSPSAPRRHGERGTVDAGRSEESGAARLSQSRQRKAQQKMRLTTMLLVVPTAVASVMLMAMAHVVFRDWRSYESEARIAKAQLAVLTEQLDTGKRRVNSLSSPKGREQILAERGYIRPGDRLLLFPSEPVPGEGATQARNDIAARRAIRNAASSSAWDRAARSMAGWLGGSSSTTAPAKPSAAPTAAAPSSNAVSEDVSDDEDGIAPQDRIVSPREDASP